MQKRDKTTYIVIHTAAWPGDPSVEDIRGVHVDENGWDDIGYHYVIRKNGRIENGREQELVGAHCRAAKMNHRSIGICMSGHGDEEPLTEEQRISLATLVSGLMLYYPIPVDHVIGHREAGANKTCPGTKVNMDDLRGYIDKYYHSRGQVTPMPLTDDLNEQMAAFDKDGDGIDDKTEADIEKMDFDAEMPPLPEVPNKKFKNTKFGRTLLGKNKWGKAVYGVLGVGVTAATGFDIGPIQELITGNETGVLPTITNIMELDIWSILIFIVSSLITLFIGRQAFKGWINDVALELKDALQKLEEAREADSPGGKAITEAERNELYKEGLDILKILWRRLLRNRIARLLGLNPELLEGDKNKQNDN